MSHPWFCSVCSGYGFAFCLYSYSGSSGSICRKNKQKDFQPLVPRKEECCQNFERNSQWRIWKTNLKWWRKRRIEGLFIPIKIMHIKLENQCWIGKYARILTSENKSLSTRWANREFRTRIIQKWIIRFRTLQVWLHSFGFESPSFWNPAQEKRSKEKRGHGGFSCFENTLNSKILYVVQIDWLCWDGFQGCSLQLWSHCPRGRTRNKRGVYYKKRKAAAAKRNSLRRLNEADPKEESCNAGRQRRRHLWWRVP